MYVMRLFRSQHLHRSIMTGASKKLPPGYLTSQQEVDEANDELDIGNLLGPSGQSAPIPTLDSTPHRTAEPSALYNDVDTNDYEDSGSSQGDFQTTQHRRGGSSHPGVEAHIRNTHRQAQELQYSDRGGNAHGSVPAAEPQQQPPSPASLSHVDHSGRASMVDVTQKVDTARIAVASARVLLGPVAYELVAANQIAKGDVLTVSKLAGIMAAKQTAYLIPLCHPLMLSKVDVQLRLDAPRHSISITGSVTAVGRTGVEMEALTAVSVAALTVYDMCKAVSKDIVISDIQLDSKRGGKSGDYAR